jgi:hypothetical protein
MAAPPSDRPTRPLVRVGEMRQVVLEEFDPATLAELQVPAFLRRPNSPELGRLSLRSNEDIRKDVLANTPSEESVSEIAGVAIGDAPKLAPTPRRRRRRPPDDQESPLSAFLAELDFNGSRVLPRELLRKHGITVESGENTTVDLPQAVRQVAVLVSALEEAADYNLQRHHNQPPPALWISNPDYLTDLRTLLVELRKLNEHLEARLHPAPTKELEKSTSLAVVAGKKFIESYADVLGKGAAALTIGAVATMFVSLGVDKGTVDVIWNLLKPSK